MSFPQIARGPPPYHNMEREHVRLLEPDANFLPSLSTRDPIMGRAPSYTKSYPDLTRKQRAAYVRSCQHSNSVFTDTRAYKSFYIISPDWTSEASGHRQLKVQARQKYGYDRRPEVQPLASFYLPELGAQTARETSHRGYVPAPVDYKPFSARDPVDFNTDTLAEDLKGFSSMPYSF